MAYWVLLKIGPVAGRARLHTEFFEEWIEAFAYSKLQQADRGREAEIVEAHDCERPTCDAYPEWGLPYCEECQ
jgi:hypothetical protein